MTILGFRPSWGAAICCRSLCCRANVPQHCPADAHGGFTDDLPLRLDVFDETGRKVAERFLGCLPRDHDLALEVDDVATGHAELVYDFRDGGEADGWLHALFRYEIGSPATPLSQFWRAHLQHGP